MVAICRQKRREYQRMNDEEIKKEGEENGSSTEPIDEGQE